MEKKKSPALTSPWKIGFLVFLLLIFLSIGVHYFLFRSFDLSWTWLEFGGGKWLFHPERFFSEMFPQLVLLAILSLTAFFLVTRSVREYKAFLDSGLDYHRLISSIQTIGDLTEEKIRKLRDYPELQKFLVRLMGDLVEREEAVRKKEKELLKRPRVGLSPDDVKRQCDELIRVVRGSREGLVKSNLSQPDFCRVAEEIRESLVQGGHRWGDEEKARLEGFRKELIESGIYLRSKLGEISGELRDSCETAKEIEKQLGELRGFIEPEDGGEGKNHEQEEYRRFRDSLLVIQKLSSSLKDLGEEVRGVAISAALNAGSGEGTLADLIQLAEGVREVAGKFEQIAQSYCNLSTRLQRSVSLLESSRHQAGGDVFSLATMLSSKVSLWVERVIILSDKIRTLEKSYNLSLKTLEDRISGYTEEEQGEEFPIESQSAGSVFSREGESKGEGQEDFEKISAMPRIFADGGRGFAEDGDLGVTGEERFEGAPFEPSEDDLPGGAASRGVPPEIEEAAIPGGDSAEQEMFVEFSAGAKREDEPVPSAGSGDRRRQGEGRPDSAGPVDDYGPGDAARLGAATERSPRKVQELPRDQLPYEDEEEAIDLYELGAVDYEAHHSSQKI